MAYTLRIVTYFYIPLDRCPIGAQKPLQKMNRKTFPELYYILIY